MKLNVKIENQTYEVIIHDLSTRPILATVNGETFQVSVDSAGQPVASPVPTAATPTPVPTTPLTPAPAVISPAIPPSVPSNDGKLASVNAPIPGVIVAVNVKEGDTVEKGKELVVLEAMKMKNSIRANRSGTVAKVLVAVGASVKRDQKLVELAD